MADSYPAVYTLRAFLLGQSFSSKEITFTRAPTPAIKSFISKGGVYLELRVKVWQAFALDIILYSLVSLKGSFLHLANAN
jgi:hypothetical protein